MWTDSDKKNFPLVNGFMILSWILNYSNCPVFVWYFFISPNPHIWPSNLHIYISGHQKWHGSSYATLEQWHSLFSMTTQLVQPLHPSLVLSFVVCNCDRCCRYFKVHPKPNWDLHLHAWSQGLSSAWERGDCHKPVVTTRNSFRLSPFPRTALSPHMCLPQMSIFSSISLWRWLCHVILWAGPLRW